VVLENLRDQMIPALLFKHEMHMSRPPRMPLQQSQQLAHRPIMRNRIWHRHDGLEPESSLLVSSHHTSPIHALSLVLLHIIMTCAVRLPDIDLNVRDGVPSDILDAAEDQAWLAGWVAGHQFPVSYRRCFVGVEGAENRSFCRGGRFGMVNCVDEQGETENV
jgi:hypothetical protein